MHLCGSMLYKPYTYSKTHRRYMVCIIRGQSIKKPNFLKNFLNLQLNLSPSKYSSPLLIHCSQRPGTCFAGWREDPVSNFLLSQLPSEISNLLVRISTPRTRKGPQGPNLESREARGQQSSHAS